jgi:hypothetical protein
MERKLLLTVEGVRMEIEGQEILIIRIPMPAIKHPPGASIDEVTKPIDYLMRLQQQMPVVLVVPRDDGTFLVAAPAEWKEKLRSKTILASQWTKIPIFEDDLEQPPDRQRRF